MRSLIFLVDFCFYLCDEQSTRRQKIRMKYNNKNFYRKNNLTRNCSNKVVYGAPDKTLPESGKVLFLYHGRNLNFDSSSHIRDLMREKGVTNVYTSEIGRKVIL